MKPIIVRHQDEDGTEWFEILDDRYRQMVRQPDKERRSGYVGTEKITKFSEDELRAELSQQFDLDDVAIAHLIDDTRRSAV